jgi:hypothetical protein
MRKKWSFNRWRNEQATVAARRGVLCTSDGRAALAAVEDDGVGVLVDHGAAVRAPPKQPLHLLALHHGDPPPILLLLAYKNMAGINWSSATAKNRVGVREYQDRQLQGIRDQLPGRQSKPSKFSQILLTPGYLPDRKNAPKVINYPVPEPPPSMASNQWKLNDEEEETARKQQPKRTNRV